MEERGSVDRCLAAMLLRWMNEKDDVKAFGGATKGKLVSALEEIQEIALAESISQTTLGDLKACITIICYMFMFMQSCIPFASVHVSAWS